MKNMTRRDFLRASAVGAVSLGALASVGGLTAANAEGAALYNAGTYTSDQSTGFATVRVTTVFSESAIEDISYEVIETSASDFFPNFTDQLNEMLEKIKAAQNVNVDAVSGATLCSSAPAPLHASATNFESFSASSRS